MRRSFSLKSRTVICGMAVLVLLSSVVVYALSIMAYGAQSKSTFIFPYMQDAEKREIVSSFGLSHPSSKDAESEKPTVLVDSDDAGYYAWIFWDWGTARMNESFETEFGTVRISKGGMLMLEDSRTVIDVSFWTSDDGKQYFDGEDFIGCATCTTCTAEDQNDLNWLIRKTFFHLTELGISYFTLSLTIAITFLVANCLTLVGLVIGRRRYLKRSTKCDKCY